MAETTAAFQADAFDFGFDDIDIIPVLFKVVVEPPYARIEAGQSVSITIYIIDNISTPGKLYPFTLITAPSVEFFSPTDVSLGAAVLMMQRGDGVYSYTHLTDDNDAKGAYSAVFTAANGTSEMDTKKHVVFTIV